MYYAYYYAGSKSIALSDPDVTITGFDTSKLGKTSFDVTYQDMTITVDTTIYNPEFDNTVFEYQQVFMEDTVYEVGEDMSMANLRLSLTMYLGEHLSSRQIRSEDMKEYIIGDIYTSSVGTKSFKIDMESFIADKYDSRYDIVEALKELEIFYTVVEAEDYGD